MESRKYFLVVKSLKNSYIEHTKKKHDASEISQNSVKILALQVALDKLLVFIKTSAYEKKSLELLNFKVMFLLSRISMTYNGKNFFVNNNN